MLNAGYSTIFLKYTKSCTLSFCLSLIFTPGLHIVIIFNNSKKFCHRAIYFAAYSTAKEKLNGVLEPDSTQVHMVSAGMAGNDASFSLSLPLLSVCLSLSVISACVCLSAWAVQINGFYERKYVKEFFCLHETKIFSLSSHLY